MILKQVEKGAEFTYGVHGPSLLEFVPDNDAVIMHPAIATDVLQQLDKCLMGSVRSLNEKHGLLRQGIAYMLPWTRNAEGQIMFLVYCRKKTNNEGQLALKLSLAPGGHIEKDDLEYYYVRPGNDDQLLETPVLDHLAILGNNLRRELQEEVHFHGPSREDNIGLHAASHAQPCGFVMDSKPEHGYVGNIHFGALYVVPVPRDTAFNMKEKHNEGQGWFTADQLRAVVDTGANLPEGNAPFEPWSKMVIGRIELVEQVINDIWPVA
ncbi:hypothetical protein D3C81_288050 [compost metagenome]